MLVTISIILTCLSLAVILIIIIRKFPALAILDVTNVPGKRESKFKDKIIQSRVERDVAKFSGLLGRLWLQLSKYLSSALKARQAQLQKLKNSHKVNLKIPWLEKQKKIRELLSSAKDALKKEDNLAAEEKLVEIASLDQKNLEAFFLLGELYGHQKKWAEAQQTLEYSLKLARQLINDDEENREITLQEIYFSLAEIEKEADNFADALENIREALEIEPNNPRFLDLILDLSIMKKDKELAQESWARLAVVNPENQKLSDWQEKIDKLI